MSKRMVVVNGVVFTNLVASEYLEMHSDEAQKVFEVAKELNDLSRPVWENSSSFFQRNSKHIREALTLLKKQRGDHSW